MRCAKAIFREHILNGMRAQLNVQQPWAGSTVGRRMDVYTYHAMGVFTDSLREAVYRHPGIQALYTHL
jgi:hypothetical protein